MFTVDDYLPRRFDMRYYNCWHFANDVWCDLTGERIECRQIGSFVKLDKPSSPCFALMQKHNSVPHVGIFYEGRVLHLHPIRGACFEQPFVAAVGFQETSYYVTRAYENSQHR